MSFQEQQITRTHHFQFAAQTHGDELTNMARLVDNLTAKGQEIVAISHWVLPEEYLHCRLYDVFIVTRESA